MKITGAIFDLDGTLVDSMKIWDVLPGKVVRSFGAEPTDDLAYQLAAMDKQEAADYMIKTFLLPLSREEVLNRVNELVDEEYSSVVPLKKGADVLLEFLHSNKIPCSIATASEVSQAEQAMKRLGQWECFQFVLSCMQCGSKSSPQIYYQAAERMGTAPEQTLVFEDALHAAQTAKKAGFVVVGVFDPSSAADEQKMRAVCDFYLPSLDDPVFLNHIKSTRQIGGTTFCRAIKLQCKTERSLFYENSIDDRWKRFQRRRRNSGRYQDHVRAWNLCHERDYSLDGSEHHRRLWNFGV